jgi:hypothetical protein
LYVLGDPSIIGSAMRIEARWQFEDGFLVVSSNSDRPLSQPKKWVDEKVKEAW